LEIQTPAVSIAAGDSLELSRFAALLRHPRDRLFTRRYDELPALD
jgi:hypothetical protein